KRQIHITDRGRGPQLSTSRVTVQDLVPYFQEGCSYEEIIRWIPTLSVKEITVVEEFYRQHQREMDEQDRVIRDRNAQRKNPERVEEIVREARTKRLGMMEKLRSENGNGASSERNRSS